MDTILDFIKKQLEDYLANIFGDNHKSVGFIPDKKYDPIVFDEDEITILIVNLEEDRIMRPDELYRRKNQNHDKIDVKPEIRLNMYLLMVANMDYKEAWKQLLWVIRFFQSNPIFNKDSVSDFPSELHQLIFELKTSTFSEQNELWSMLKIAYRPSVLYRVKMIIIQDMPLIISPTISKVEYNI